jgi:diguanylate cyclase (GGDEF)-like protein
MKQKLPLIRTMQIGFGAVVLLLMVIGVVAYRNVTASTSSARWVQHTSDVLEHIAELRSAIESIADSYRDRAQSSDPASLQRVHDTAVLARQEESTLRALTADNPSQQQRLALIAPLAQRIIQRADASAPSHPQGDGQAPAGDDNARGDPVLNQFRDIVSAMATEERHLLRARNTEGERRYSQSKLALIFVSALALAIAAISGWLLPRAHAQRWGAEDKFKRLNRLYATISGINALGLRVRNRGDLYNNSCRVAVEHGEFLMAWIGIVQGPEATLVPMAWAGVDDATMGTMKRVFSSNGPALHGKVLVERALSEKAPMVWKDVKSDESLVLGKLPVQSAVRSIAILPLMVADKAIGVLVLYTDKSEFFDADGMLLLTELAGNVALAMDHIEKQERLDHLAYYDALTGLANRSLFLDRVTQYMRSAATDGHKLAMFLIDIERFKKFNDTLGRPAGDGLLLQVADWMKRNVGNAHSLARVGADQFAVVLPEVTYEADVIRVLEKTMVEFMNHAFVLDDVVYRIAAKVGVVLFPDDGTDADTLFNNAEAALKKAKVSGDRYLFYAQKMNETVAGSLGIENRLRQALEHEEFVLHYQPKVNLVSGELTGAEALIRWNDPQNGLQPPARFIPILEQTGLIHAVGRWALRKALEDFQRWRSTGLAAVRIAVNVSPLQLRNRSFVAEIEQALSIGEGAGAGLELEITESLIMEDVNHSIVSLLAIRALGVTVAIDDFGTGFSSLSYLSKLPVDTLKIDRSFVVDMVAGTGGLTLVSVIINLAHALKLNVVAEGVATEEQLRQLRLLHCDEMQGFLFGKPVPVEIFEKRYLTRSPGLMAV